MHPHNQQVPLVRLHKLLVVLATWHNPAVALAHPCNLVADLATLHSKLVVGVQPHNHRLGVVQLHNLGAVFLGEAAKVAEVLHRLLRKEAGLVLLHSRVLETQLRRSSQLKQVALARLKPHSVLLVCQQLRSSRKCAGERCILLVNVEEHGDSNLKGLVE